MKRAQGIWRGASFAVIIKGALARSKHPMDESTRFARTREEVMSAALRVDKAWAGQAGDAAYRGRGVGE